jgi:hypothetical protein
MSQTLDPLLRDLLAWVADRPRPYDEMIEAWRTSCPRLTVWEEAVERGFVTRERVAGRGAMIRATAAGLAFLRAGRDGASDPAR